MIIKSVTRRQGASKNGAEKGVINYIFRYVFDGRKQLQTINGKPPLIITQNIKNRTSIQTILREFEVVEKRRVHKRSNNVIEHVIISFSPLSSPHITDAILRDIGNKYLSLRGKDVIACGTQHLDRNHKHLHICLGLKVNGLSSRVSKEKYAQIKADIQQYQIEKYPQLCHSLVGHARTNEQRITRLFPTFANQRTKQKEEIAKLLKAAYVKANSRDHFSDLLKEQQIHPYYRNSDLAGITYEGGRKYRLAKFGYDREVLDKLDQSLSIEKGLEQLQKLRHQSKVHTLEQNDFQKTKSEQLRLRLDALGIKGFREQSLTRGIPTEHR